MIQVDAGNVRRMSPEPTDVEFLTPREVAALMRYSVDRIQWMLKAGKIAGAVRFGSSWRIHKHAFLESIGCTDDPHRATGRKS